MGSLSGSLTPVVPKTSITFRKRPVKITETYSVNDTVGGKVIREDDRAITSGSIVRDDNTVEYIEDLAFGVTMMGRTNIVDRVPSAGNTASRSVIVDLGDNQTDAVIPTYLVPDVPQNAARHTGNKVVIGLSVDDSVVERISNSGVYSG